jgi:hypothetical protein
MAVSNLSSILKSELMVDDPLSDGSIHDDEPIVTSAMLEKRKQDEVELKKRRQEDTTLKPVDDKEGLIRREDIGGE